MNLVHYRMSLLSLNTFMAGFGDFHLLNKLPSGEAGINPYCVEFLKVSLISLVGSQAKYGLILS